MPKRSAKPLTIRERQCRKAAREKRLRKAFEVWRRRALIVCGGMVFLLAVSGTVWEWRRHGITRTIDAGIARAYAATGRMGFAVTTMVIEDRHRTPLSEVEKTLAVKKGEPIFALSLDTLREQLEKLPTVKYAFVERELPGTLRVRLEERQPVAVWQLHDRLTLIDDEGTAMRDLSISDYPSLPLVVGQGAAQHVVEALGLLSAAPGLAPKVEALVRVGDRRWDVHLRGGLLVKLPEENAAEVWRRFADMDYAHHLLSLPLRSVDLRLQDRYFFRFLPGAAHDGVSIPAKET